VGARTKSVVGKRKRVVKTGNRFWRT